MSITNIVGLKIRTNDLCTIKHKNNKTIHEFIDEVIVFRDNGFFDDHTNYLSKNNENITINDININIGELDINDFFGILCIGNNKYCLQKLSNNNNDLYISIYTNFFYRESEKRPIIPLILLIDSITTFKKDMKKINLWDEEKFGVHTIF